MEGDVEVALRQLDYTKPAQVKALGDKIREQGYRRVRELLEWHNSDDEDMARRADAVLIELGDLPVGAMKDALSSDPPQLVWEMQLLTDVQLQDRQWLSERLDSMLEDTTLMPGPDLSAGFEEATPPPRRVCDEAYLMLRKLLAFETDTQILENTDEFLGMSDDKRDEEIKRVRATHEWKALVEPMNDDDSE